MAVRKGKRSKVKFVWTKEFIFLIVGILALVVTAIILVQPSDKDKIYNAFINEVGDSDTALTYDHVYSSISHKKLVKKINSSNDDELIFVFYGSSKDKTSVSSIEIINLAAQRYEVDTVYYLSADFMIDEDEPDTLSFRNYVEEREVELKEVDLDNYPSLWVFKNGELLFTSDKYRDTDTKTIVAGWKAISYDAFSFNKLA